MASTEMLFVFAYDVARDAARRRIADLLEQKLSRTQDSVFEGWLKPEAARQLARLASAEISDEDSLRVFAVPRAMLKHCHVSGPLPLMEPHDYWLL